MWTPQQLKQINQALVSAFTTGELRQFVRFTFGMPLDELVGEVGRADVVFRLVEWALARGLLAELITKAYEERPRNEALQQLAEGLATPGAPPRAPSPAVPTGPAAATTRTDIGIVIPLAEEFRELFSLIADAHQVEHDQELNQVYYRFEQGQRAPGQRYTCVATFVGDMGEQAAGRVTERLINRYRPGTVVVLGIAAGIHGDVRVGDVIAARVVDSYIANAKAVPDEGGSFEFQLSGDPYRPSPELLAMLSNLEFAHRNLYATWSAEGGAELRALVGDGRAERLVADSLVSATPGLHLADVASGPIVGAASEFSAWLRKRNRAYKALEMESGGIMSSAFHRREAVRTLVLRGISDFGDPRKKDLDAMGAGALRRYAVRNATRLLWALLGAGLLPTS